jgi:RNA polymerase sigma-70 factor (ECF subfamily)
MPIEEAALYPVRDCGAESRATRRPTRAIEGADSRTLAHASGDRHLVARLRAGESAALDELYRAYRKPIFGFLIRLAKDRHAAEDLFQNTWLKVSRSIERLREDTELRAWVFTVARNEFRSYRRWQLIDLSRLFLFDREREDVSNGTTVDSGENMAAAAVEGALASLGAPQRCSAYHTPRCGKGSAARVSG